MHFTPLLIVALLVAGRTTFALFSGSAAMNNQGYRREQTPFIYWFSIIGGYAVSAGLIVVAVRQYYSG